MTWWGNWGPLIAQWKIWGPLMMQWGNWKPLIKQWGSSGTKWPDGKTRNWALDGATEHLGPSDYAMDKLETLAMGKLGPLMIWWRYWGPRSRSSFQTVYTTPLNSFKLMGPNWEILDVIQAEKQYMGPKFPIVHLVFQRLRDGYQCLILIFSFIYLDLWGYISGGAPVRVFEKFRSLFFLFFLSSFLFFFFLFFVFFLFSFLFFLLSFSFLFFSFLFFSFLFFLFFSFLFFSFLFFSFLFFSFLFFSSFLSLSRGPM